MVKQRGRHLVSLLLAICLFAGGTGCGQAVNSANEQKTATEAEPAPENAADNESREGTYVDNPDREYMEEKRVHGVEEEFMAVLEKCHKAGLAKSDVKELLELLLMVRIRIKYM